MDRRQLIGAIGFAAAMKAAPAAQDRFIGVPRRRRLRETL